MKSKKKLIIGLAAFAVVIALYVWGFALQTVTYTVDTDKTDSLKIVFLSDLHNSTFGGGDQSVIWDAVNEAEPDLVLFGGDVIDMWSGTKYALRLMKMVKDKYPCAYSPGNHEEERDDKNEFYSDVKALGIPILAGDKAEFDIKGRKICVYGIINPDAWGKNDTELNECRAVLDEKCYNILLSHPPERLSPLIDENEKQFDLILSGHAHGGQWRIPKILDQGLFAPGQGVFPDYTCGKYSYGDTVHIVSKGLAKPVRMLFIPRIFNRPELTVINVQ